MEDLKLIPNFPIQELYEHLLETFDDDVASSFRRNKIAGSHFLKLSEKQIGEMVPSIGDIVDLQTLRGEVCKAQLQVLHYVNCAGI